MTRRPRALPQIFIVLELITGGELFDKIVAEGKCVGQRLVLWRNVAWRVNDASAIAVRARASARGRAASARALSSARANSARRQRSRPAPLLPRRFDEAKARYYFRQLIKGVKYCHSQGAASGSGWFADGGGWRCTCRAHPPAHTARTRTHTPPIRPHVLSRRALQACATAT